MKPKFEQVVSNQANEEVKINEPIKPTKLDCSEALQAASMNCKYSTLPVRMVEGRQWQKDEEHEFLMAFGGKTTVSENV